MATHKSAIKRMRQAARRRARNRANRSRLKTDIKKFRTMAAEGKAEECRRELPGLVSLIDETLKKGSIHENKASRYKSRLARLATG